MSYKHRNGFKFLVKLSSIWSRRLFLEQKRNFFHPKKVHNLNHIVINCFDHLIIQMIVLIQTIIQMIIHSTNHLTIQTKINNKVDLLLKIVFTNLVEYMHILCWKFRTYLEFIWCKILHAQNINLTCISWVFKICICI